MIYLDDLLAQGAHLHGEASVKKFEDFSYDSRLTRPGELFLAIQTSRADGHDYIPAALAAGAQGVVCSWLPRHTEGATFIVTENTEKLVQQWAAYRLREVAPAVVAVTGSVGKTSTKRAIATLLGAIQPAFASRQSFNSLLGLPIAIARLHEKHSFAVLEFGSDRFGEIEQLAALFPPQVGVVTNIGQAHLKSFGSLEGVAREKGMLVEALPPAGWAILNGDDPLTVAMQSRTAAQVLTFGQSQGCHLRASNIACSLHETHFRLHWHGHEALNQTPSSIDCQVPLIGRPAVPIALAAATVALVYGIPMEQIAHQLTHVSQLNGRLHVLPTTSGATLIDDTFNASLPSVMAALRTLQDLPAKRRIVVLGSLADHTDPLQYNPDEPAALISKTADMLICKGDWGTPVIHRARQIRPALKANIVYTATAALQALPSNLGAGDIILVKGSTEARMERIVAGLLDPSMDTSSELVRQEPAWYTVRIGLSDRPTSVRVDLDAIAHNIRQLQTIARVPLMAVVKADAYGHGAVRVARAALASNAAALAVATLSEARTLREADITAPILVLGYTPPWQAREAVRLGISCAIYDFDVAQAFSHAAVALKRRATVHVKVDTGMGRLGMTPEQVEPFLQAVNQLPDLYVEGIYSHFATADSDDETFARLQLERFQQVLANIIAAGLRPPLVHMANSAALLRFPEARFDIVRPGIACYGLNPSAQTPLPPECRPALSFHTEVAQVKPLPVGSSLSYGCTFVTERPSHIATIPVGYADGFRRVPPWREVLVRGQRAPVVGRVCMDYAMIDVTEIEGVRRGDPVVIIGEQCDDAITADEVAGWLETINYEVVSAILPRVPREVGE